MALQILVSFDVENVVVFDPATNQARVMKDVQSVTFADGTTFPAPRQEEEEPVRRYVETLAGRVRVG